MSKNILEEFEAAAGQPVPDICLVSDPRDAGYPESDFSRGMRAGLLKAEQAILNNGRHHLSRGDAALIVRGLISQTESGL